jgi:hypothetical protein
VGRRGPRPARASAVRLGVLQRASAVGARARGRVDDRDGVSRGRARGGFVTAVAVRGRGGDVDGGRLALSVRTRGRVGRLDLVALVLDEVPLLVLVVLAVVVALGVLLGRVHLVDLEARRVFVAVAVVWVLAVSDGYSFPKFDGNVSVALRGGGAARRRRVRDAALARGARHVRRRARRRRRLRARSRAARHAAPVGEGYD